jgi:SAM-dependent methyltransferase
MRPAHSKSQADITAEWDRIASVRERQIASGKDLSFSLVLMPCVLELSEASAGDSVVDVGCGPGFTTAALASVAGCVVGIDASGRSLEFAGRRVASLRNVRVVQSTIEDYAAAGHGGTFSLAIANMTLPTVLDLDGVLRAIVRLLRPRGRLVATITHPCFWPFYWGYANAEWFSYDREIPVEAPFRISLEPEPGPITTHLHRPLWRYLGALRQAGMSVDVVKEPMPRGDAEKQYPIGWQYPRFLAFRCTRD